MAAWRLTRNVLAWVAIVCVAASAAWASDLCPDEQPTPQVPTDLALCAALDPVVRKPGALPLNAYEATLDRFFSNYCHRRTTQGWAMDKTVRDAGPFVATLGAKGWSGADLATHQPVLIWYSPEMVRWLRQNRPADATKTPVRPAPVPDGAIMVKEMYGAASGQPATPASACRVPDLLRLKPVRQGAALMIRDSAAAKDGWFWGWYGWPNVNSGWHVDWPAQAGNAPPFMGFGQYCLNCHASARDNQTFASLGNIKGEPGTYLTFLSQDWFLNQRFATPSQKTEALSAPPTQQSDSVHQRLLTLERAAVAQSKEPAPPVQEGTLRALRVPVPLASLTPAKPPPMPSQTYDNVWVPGHGPAVRGEFVTADQCVGCHSAGGTGLTFDMTMPVPDSPTNQLYNYSPYGTWRTSPMGLAGRDPVFFAQLASETQTFHPSVSPLVQDTCLGCHGFAGQRQFKIDHAKPGGACPDYLRSMVDAIPYSDPKNPNPDVALAHFGALSRDGVSCTACHRMILGAADTRRYADEAQNRCVKERQDFLNPGATGFARTFTGSFFVGPPDTIWGPFEKPKQKPMQHALGFQPQQGTTIRSSELCGACHTVHLPVMRNGTVIGHTYEQTTYPEWAFSAYRTGDSPDGPLPFGPGPLARSCQDCHMPSADAAGRAFRSKIAGIQEHSNFPAVENGLGAEDIDLSPREGFAKHTLVGLNVFLVQMAKQMPDLLGMQTQDPMLVSRGVPPLDLTEQAMLEQATKATATIAVQDVTIGTDALQASVTVTNTSGHKFPSGVGFRRAFVDFAVLDSDGKVLWESGRTDAVGTLVDDQGHPVAGEHWWSDDCKTALNKPGDNPHQPHYRTIQRQDQVQIFQELVTAPPPNGPAQCGHGAAPLGVLTTSFLSICAPLKDNRLLPKGFLPFDQRVRIAKALGAGADMAEDVSPVGTGDDPGYRDGSGSDTFSYRIPLSDIPGRPASVTATLYYQATPPFFLQDRLCTATGVDRERLQYMVRHLDTEKQPRISQWKLNMVSSGPVAVP